MRQKLIKLFSFVLICFVLTACKTISLSTKVDLGMTKEQVVKICGKPYKQAKKYDIHQNLQEIFFYKEEIWDNGGWSKNSTIINNIFIFNNGILIAIEQGDEERHTPVRIDIDTD